MDLDALNASPSSIIFCRRTTTDRPLHNGIMVGEAGFEPTAPCSQGKCSTKLSYSPMYLPSVSRSFRGGKVCRPLPDIPLHEIFNGLTSDAATGFYKNGARYGNRTRARCLEGTCTAAILTLHICRLLRGNRTFESS